MSAANERRPDRAGVSEADPIGEKSLQHVVAGGAIRIVLVPAGGVFEGQVSIQGDTRIEGIVRGTLRGTGRLCLGPEARIEGEIECHEVRCQGAIVGTVMAQRRIELGPAAVVEGDLDTPRLEVAENALWTGLARVGL